MTSWIRTARLNRFRSAVRTPVRPLRVAALGLGVLVVACAGKDPAAYDTAQAQRLFAVGFEDISEIYIEKVQVQDLALAGLERIESVDPKVAIEPGRNAVAVRVAGGPARAFPLPHDDDAEAWGRLTASVLDDSRRRSPALDRASAEAIYEAVFEGMLTRLDRYSRYAGASAARRNRASRDGFGGIGITVRASAEGIEILSVMPGSPAAEAGLHAGDLIVRVGNTPAVGLDQDTVVRKLRGRVGTTVDLTIRRAEDRAPLPLAVNRAHIVPRTVTYRREDDAAYIRISGFNQDTAASLRTAIRRAKADIGDHLKGFILDLRGNPGGLLDQAVEVSDLFITNGQIVSTHGRHPDSHQYFDAAPDDLADGLPVVTLVNAGSASASEIVAAALQDSGRGVVVGSASYGKGTVQTVLRLPNRGELTLTWARFHAPSGYALSRRGVIPDVCTSGDDLELSAILAALRDDGRPLDRQVQWRARVPAGADEARSLRANCPGRRGEGALDREVALRLLHERDLYRSAAGHAQPRLAQAHH